MAFFSSKKSKPEEVKQPISKPTPKPVEVSKDIIKTPTHDVSVLRNLLKVKANIEGGGSLVIGGTFDGEVIIENTVFIEKGAKFFGTVRAKEVKISGNFEGTIYANAVEVTPSGKYSGVINSNKAFLGGEIEGVIKSVNSIEVTKSGKVNTKECKSKNIKIVGQLSGKVIASELLEITSGGSVNGTIITKGIKTEQGGSVIGNIQTYDPQKHDSNASFDDDKSAKDTSNLVNVSPEDMKKYARKDKKDEVKKIPADK